MAVATVRRTGGYRPIFVRFRLLPTDAGFFRLFDEAGANVAECSRRLQALLRREATIDAIVECEHRGDQLTRDVLHRLNTSFVTPFDREDIHALAEHLDDAVDHMLEVAYRLDLGDRDVAVMPELQQQADILVQMGAEIEVLVRGLATMKGLREPLDRVDALESEGDLVYRHALRRLYSDDFKARATLYWKDVVETMERALDSIEDVSNVVESVVLKHA